MKNKMSIKEQEKLEFQIKVLITRPTMLQILRLQLAASASQGIPKFMHRADRAEAALEFADELISQSQLLK